MQGGTTLQQLHEELDPTFALGYLRLVVYGRSLLLHFSIAFLPIMSSQISVSKLSTPSPSFPNPYIVHRALSNGRKASKELKGQNRGQRCITAGHHVEGVCQDFVLHGANTVSFFGAIQLHTTLDIYLQATIKIPVTLTKNVGKKDVFRLLEAQQMEHLLIEEIAASPSASSNSNRYYSQVLMTQRLQRAELEVELYRLAISEDGLLLLEGTYSLPSFTLEGTHRYVETGEYQDDCSDEDDIQGGP